MRISEAYAVQNNIHLQFTYDVYFSKDVFNSENIDLVNIISKNSSDNKSTIIIFIDQGLLDCHHKLLNNIRYYFHAHQEKLTLADTPIPIPGGETCKTDPKTLDSIYQTLFNHKIDRHSFVLVIGGGAVLDVVGYAAATTHRGIRLLRMPTTVLAQNDGGIGVKTGVNRYNQKNFIGAFAAPFAVINDSKFLDTLSARDKRAGMAEAIKVALIRDNAFFEWMEINTNKLIQFDNVAIQYLIKKCAELHLSQITNGGDPFESGSSRPLDFGHWSAHKLESMSRFALKHGEAVAIGIAIDTRYALEIKKISENDFKRIILLLANLGFKLNHPAMKKRKTCDALELLDGIEEFREHLGGELTITLPNSIGKEIEIHDICRQTMEKAIAYIADRNEKK